MHPKEDHRRDIFLFLVVLFPIGDLYITPLYGFFDLRGFLSLWVFVWIFIPYKRGTFIGGCWMDGSVDAYMWLKLWIF